MDAMIFAAGLGTRLGPIGQSTTKALLTVGGMTMLERTIRRLVAAGVDRIVVNVHHHADAIERYLLERDFGVVILLSHERERPLETGGGLWHARRLFRGDVPILLHNVDVITDDDLGAMVAAHDHSRALATLAVHARESSRVLLFDDAGLFGREDRREGVKRTESRPPQGAPQGFAFAGIHVCAPDLLDLIVERGAFSIVDVYLRLAGEGHRLEPWLPPGGTWLEIGSAERLEATRAALGGNAAGEG